MQTNAIQIDEYFSANTNTVNCIGQVCEKIVFN